MMRHAFAACCLAFAFVAAGRAQDPEEPTPLTTPRPTHKPKMPKTLDKEKFGSSVLEGELTDKDDVEPGRGYRKTHIVKLEAGVNYRVELEMEEDSTPLLLIRKLDGKEVFPAGLGSAGDAGGVFTPDATAPFEVVVTTRNGEVVGKYVVRIWPLDPEPDRDFRRRTMPIEAGDITITPIAPLVPGNEGTMHGYVEHRVLVQNWSETQKHQVTLWVPRGDSDHRWGNSIRSIKKTATIGPKSAIHMSVFQPFVRLANNPVSAEVDGKPVDLPLDISRDRGPDSEWVSRHGMTPSVLLLDNPTSDNRLRATFGLFMEVDRKGRRENELWSLLPIEQISKHWLGLGAFDGIVVAGKALDAAPDAAQRALWQYVETGGALVVQGPCSRIPVGQDRRSKSGITRTSMGFGECIHIERDDAARLSDANSAALMGTLEETRKPWSQITTAGDAHRNFPVVDNIAIPVRGLCAFMLVFVVIIGPVNLYILSRLRRRIWLLWTVPVLSLLTTGLLFGYVAVTEGWRPHMRADVVTFLDERTQRASSIGWLGYYSPMSSGSGLHFSQDTELSPHFEGSGHGRWRGSDDVGERSLTIDWTTDQHLHSGWLTAKVPLHFLVRRSQKRQERLQVRVDDGTIVAVNGLGVDLDKLWIADKDSVLHSAEGVRAGVETKLAKTETIAKKPVKTVVPGELDAEIGLRQGYASNWLRLSQQLESNPEWYLRPGTYIAVTQELPFVEPGVEHVQSKKTRSVVYGVLKDVP